VQDFTIGPWAKSFPASSWGLTSAEFLSGAPRQSQFATPLLAIDAAAMESNERLMAHWASSRGLQLAPHGKTTMAPQLWQRVLDAGAWGITLATGWQVQFARSVGITRILLANELIDPVVLAWLGQELADPDFEFVCWVDSVEAVELMRAGLAGAARRVDVLVEIGAAGGRGGARGADAALAVAAAIERAPELRLAGIGGFEGSYARERTVDGVAAVSAYLDTIAEIHDRIEWSQRPIVTAGGSAWFDLVAERLGELSSVATVIVRSGVYQLHDDGLYNSVSPLRELRPALNAFTRVLSTPETGFALLDGGRRDFPYDEGLPTTEFGTITKLNDQHAYLQSSTVSVGDVIRVGISHPCTAFDKWRLIPMVRDATEPDPLVIDLVRTWF